LEIRHVTDLLRETNTVKDKREGRKGVKSKVMANL
jgi:hypothetical protein